jgi:hypothetical protein
MWFGVALASCLLAGCGLVGGDSTADIRAAQLVGRWSSPSGTTVTFDPDNTLTAAGLDQSLLGGPGEGCPAAGNGRWVFLVSGGPSSLVDSPMATDGNYLAVQVGNDPMGPWGNESVIVQQDAAGFTLCLTPDLDEGCDSSHLLRRQKSN